MPRKGDNVINFANRVFETIEWLSEHPIIVIGIFAIGYAVGYFTPH